MIKTNYKYIVYSDPEGKLVLSEFANKDEAIKFAEEHVLDVSYIDEIKSEFSESDILLNEYPPVTIWTAADFAKNAFDQDWPDDAEIAAINAEESEWDKLLAQDDGIDAQLQGKIKEMHEAMEDKEELVECQECFDLFPKSECFKADYGYLCPHCHELHVLVIPAELVDDAAFDLDFDDPEEFRDEESVVNIEAPVEEPEIITVEEPVSEIEGTSIETPAAFTEIPAEPVIEFGSDDSSDSGAEVLGDKDVEVYLENLNEEKAEIKCYELHFKDQEDEKKFGGLDKFNTKEEAYAKSIEYLDAGHPCAIKKLICSGDICSLVDLDEPNTVNEKLEERAMADTPFDSEAKEGDKIRIIHLEGEDNSYDGKEGTVEHIDGIGQLHGTWGGLAVIPGVDEFEIITDESLTEANFSATATHTEEIGLGTFEAEDEDDAEDKANMLYNDGTYDSYWDTTDITVEKVSESLEEDLDPMQKIFNIALAKAQEVGKPVIYGFMNKGTYYKTNLLVCDDLKACTKKIMDTYHPSGSVLVAYPNKSYVQEELLEDADVDYVEYMHSYCNALEPHMDELRKIEDVEELKKAILNIVNEDPDVNTTEKKNKFVWLIKNKKWSSPANIIAYLDKAMAKAKSIEVKVDDKGELVEEAKEEEVPETHEGQMDFLAKDEDEAIEGYDEVIEKTDNEHLAGELEHIRDEEIAHKEFLEIAKENPNATYEHAEEEVDPFNQDFDEPTDESLEFTCDQDLADNRTPLPTEEGELGKPVNGSEVRKHEKAIEEDLTKAQQNFLDYVEAAIRFHQKALDNAKANNAGEDVIASIQRTLDGCYKDKEDFLKACEKKEESLDEAIYDAELTIHDTWKVNGIEAEDEDEASEIAQEKIDNGKEDDYSEWDEGIQITKISEDLKEANESLQESNNEIVEVFTPEEQAEYHCDEEGNCEDSHDKLHHCGWCEEVFTESEMRHEVDFGWLCPRCEAAIKSRGEELVFIEK